MAEEKNLVVAPTWHGEIKDYFTAGDVSCMLSVTGMDLANYSSVSKHAPDIYQRVALPPDNPQRMPKGGVAWSKEKTGRFLAWMEAKYPEGEPQPAMQLESFGPVAGRVRKSLTELTGPEIDKLKKAFTGIMALDTKDRNGYFQNAAIHGLPLAYCQHHDPGFVPWHRVQMQAFEDSLRTIDGCHDVTLPYWDFSKVLPDWIYEAPFASYTLPEDISVAPGDNDPTHKKGYTTVRYDKQTIFTNFHTVVKKATVMQCISNALSERWWDAFNGMLDGTPHIDLIAAHDQGHNATGLTMSDQDVSAYDPIFWFYHCNLDRIWWLWQCRHDAKTLPDFMKTIKNQESISYMVFTNNAVGRMNPWADYKNDDELTAAFAVDLLKNFDVAYDSPMDEELPHPLKKGDLELAVTRAFTAKSEEVNVRVEDLNRTKIPGSFEVYLLKDGEPLRSAWFFQPNDVSKCANCLKTPTVHFDFRLPLEEVQGGELTISVEPAKKAMYGKTVPHKVLGNPKITISLLMGAS